MANTHSAATTKRRRALLRRVAAAAVFAAALATAALAFAACSDGALPARGSITTSDGVVLAESQNVSGGKGKRAYPQSAITSPLVGSCVTKDAAQGIEQVYEDQLLDGKDVQLTVNMDVQEAAYKALGGYAGAAVVADVKTGDILAMASTPTYDPAAEKAEAKTTVNRAAELYIPGSTFKTITLAAALEAKAVTLDTVFSAPPVLVFDGGSVANYNTMQYDDQTVRQAYAKSINTVFAQMALRVGIDPICEQARAFGFDAQILPDFPVKAATIYGASDMSGLMRAWSGVGQALFQPDGTLQGPVMTVVEGAFVAATIANGGITVPLHIVESVGGQPLASATDVQPTQAITPETAADIAECMRLVVTEGTGRSAAVKGVDVRGKTGTAETASGSDNGWFMGFASKGERTYAFCVLIEGAESAEASAVAAQIVEAL